MPTAFIIGLENAREGTWFEKVFAREVYRFDNTQNCLWAYQVLKRHGVNPGVHPRPEVNLTLRSVEKEVAPPQPPIPIPPAPQTMPLERNRQIRLFEGDDPSIAKPKARVTSPAPAPALPTSAEAVSNPPPATPAAGDASLTDAPVAVPGARGWQRWRERLQELLDDKRP
jgi:hypothetical protein